MYTFLTKIVLLLLPVYQIDAEREPMKRRQQKAWVSFHTFTLCSQFSQVSLPFRLFDTPTVPFQLQVS
jgi:hypothetical protein